MKFTFLVTFTNRAGEQIIREAVFHGLRESSTMEPPPELNPRCAGFLKIIPC